MSLNSLTCLAMEIEKNSEKGVGESFHVIECCDGVTRGAVRRDCGDHVEVIPIGLLCNQNGFVAFQGRDSGYGEQQRQLVATGEEGRRLQLSLPPIVLKFPKELPADINQSQKVLDAAVDAIKPKLIRSMVEAYNKAVEGTGAERASVEWLEQRLLEIELKKPGRDDDPSYACSSSTSG